MSIDAIMIGPPLRAAIPNVATLVERNAVRFAERVVFAEKRDGAYGGPAWREFACTVRTIAARLRAFGFAPGDKLAIVSPNRMEMLALELAVMASGGVAVPVFAHYPAQVLAQFLPFARVRFLAVAGAAQLERIDPALAVERIFVFDDVRNPRYPTLTPFAALTRPLQPEAPLAVEADPDTVCLNQFTSGTTGKPKCVQLTHRNILSQQAALDDVWSVDADDRFLSYLPWHHSFGGIFELFSALTRGAMMALESSYGRDPRAVLENWRLVRPTVFYSVPKVYQALVDLTRTDDAARAAFFHDGLKFVFTAAAPLPDPIAQEFERRGVRIIEGWGLTETAPCCTITGASSRRVAGVVGHPIPGVRVRIAEDGEIQVHGPNVMPGYFDNDEANAASFTADGWFRTGDVGRVEEGGLRLVGRRDRIFKLSNGEKVVSAEIETALQSACHYLSFAVVEGGGRDHPVALLFPNRQLLDGGGAPLEHCGCPRSLADLAACLRTCLGRANDGIAPKFARIQGAALIDDDLSIDRGTLTPSMKVVASRVTTLYRGTLAALYGDESDSGERVYIIPLTAEAGDA